VIKHYQYDQRSNSRERWYQDLIKKMMDNSLFKEIWENAQKRMSHNLNFTNFVEKTIYFETQKDVIELQLNFFTVPVFRNPRYFVEFFVPSNKTAFDFFHNRISTSK